MKLSQRIFCNQCNETLDEPKIESEYHDLAYGAPERLATCPICGNDELVLVELACDCCEEYITKTFFESADGAIFCSNCITERGLN